MDPETWQIISLTLGVAVLSTVLILPVGVALAWLLARPGWRGKSLVETVVALPLVMPPVATGLILLEVFGRHGPVGYWLEEKLGIDVVFTWRAVVIALAVMSFPLLVRTARVAFQQVNPRLEQIARTLGAGELRVFFTVSLPLAGRGIVAGTLLAFARALGEFGATIMVAGNIPGRTSTIALSIYENVLLGHDSTAYRLLAVSVAMAFAAVWGSEFLMRRRAAAP
jgi:molybdate transport system permease protein